MNKTLCSRVSWKIVALWFLCLSTFLSVYMVSHMSDCQKPCTKTSSSDKEDSNMEVENTVILYVITPTYSRSTQKAELTRMAHTLMHVKHVHWIVVEDGATASTLVADLLTRSNLHFTHLSVQTPENFKLRDDEPGWLKPKGVWQRNLALQWLRLNRRHSGQGVVYFADDDNTYDLRLFEELRWTKTVSAWPVGLVGGLKWEGPKVKHGKVVGWQTVWKPDRPFAIDMAGFAINLRLILDHPTAEFSEKRRRGFVESSLLEKLVSMADLEPKANGQVLVWHTRTEKPKLYTDLDIKKLHFDPKLFQTDVEV